jgi:hypothetical protein
MIVLWECGNRFFRFPRSVGNLVLVFHGSSFPQRVLLTNTGLILVYIGITWLPYKLFKIKDLWWTCAPKLS